MSLVKDFEKADAATVHDSFSAAWRGLIDYIEQGADGAISWPYSVMTQMNVDERLDVHFQARLCKFYGPDDPVWRTLSTRHFFNTNVAGVFPFGDTYRRLMGRNNSLTEISGPLPLAVTLSAQNIETAKLILRDWVLRRIQAEKGPNHGCSWAP